MNESVRVTDSRADVIVNSKKRIYQAPIVIVIVAFMVNRGRAITTRAGSGPGRGQGRAGARGRRLMVIR